jgi:DsbC/DsbD-like thiol-disulfide interchange protein
VISSAAVRTYVRAMIGTLRTIFARLARDMALALALALALAGAVCLAAAGRAGAGEAAPPALSAVASVDILPGWLTEAGTRMSAVRIRLAPGWKTYWRAPGDAGIPPRFDWSGSSNLAAAALHWPAPEVIRQNGLTILGYRTEVILPVEITPERPGPVRLHASLELGVCETVCLPVALTLSAELAGPGAPDPRIDAALARRPLAAQAAGVAQVRCTAEDIADGLRVTARIAMPALGSGEEIAVFELPDRSVWISEARTRREGGELVAMAEMVPPFARPFPFSPDALRITVLDGSGAAVDIRGCTG